MKQFESCQYCKHNACSVTYDLVFGTAISHKNTCKITHKEKADNDTCKRFSHRPPILAC